MAKQKKLEKDSAYSKLDLDGDGVVSDSELAALEAIENAEKMDDHRRMAWVSRIVMISFTALLYIPQTSLNISSNDSCSFLGIALIMLYLFSQVYCLVLVYRTHHSLQMLFLIYHLTSHNIFGLLLY